MFIFLSPRSPRGALARRRVSGVRCGARGQASQACTRAVTGLRPGSLRTPARSWLTPCVVQDAWRQSAARHRDENAARRSPGRRKPVPGRRAERRLCGESRAAHRNGPAPVGAPSPLTSPSDANGIARTMRRGCLRVESVPAPSPKRCAANGPTRSVAC